MAYYPPSAHRTHVDRFGVTVAVAILLRLEGARPEVIDIDRWAHEIETTLLPLLGADEFTPVGVAIRATERTADDIAEGLILDAAVACPAHFRRSGDTSPVRTVAELARPSGGITN